MIRERGLGVCHICCQLGKDCPVAGRLGTPDNFGLPENPSGKRWGLCIRMTRVSRQWAAPGHPICQKLGVVRTHDPAFLTRPHVCPVGREDLGSGWGLCVRTTWVSRQWVLLKGRLWQISPFMRTHVGHFSPSRTSLDLVLAVWREASRCQGRRHPRAPNVSVALPDCRRRRHRGSVCATVVPSATSGGPNDEGRAHAHARHHTVCASSRPRSTRPRAYVRERTLGPRSSRYH